MKKITGFFIIALCFLYFQSAGQTIIDFETDGSGYTSSSTYGSGATDVFNRVNPNIGGNSSYFWAAEDITSNASLSLNQIDVSGATSFTFSIDFLTPNSNDWDSTDEVLITYSVDGGTYQNLMWVQAIDDDAYNEPAALDLAFDTYGDYGQELPALVDDHGAGVGNTFQTFSISPISLSANTTLDIILNFNTLTSNDEGIYLDNITITQAFGGNNPPQISNINHTPSANITSSTTVSVSADVTDSDGSVSGVELHWGTASGSLGNTISMSNTGGDTYSTDSNIPAQLDGTTVFYEVYALDDDADASTSAEYNYLVTDPATTTLPYSEPFAADLGDCYTYSVSGLTKEWYWNSGGYAAINGYDSGDTEEDWLILPGINFDNYSSEVMTFDTWYDYGNDDANNYLKLYYSTDYPGMGDPSSYTWVEVSYTQPSSTQSWTSSGNLDLSSISGTSVYIAFKYHYESGSYRWWEVDNLSIIESTANSIESNIILTAGWAEPQNIDYTLYQTASGLTTSNAIEVARFTIQDGGDDLTDADALSTVLTDIEFQINHADNIRVLAIFDGTNNLSETASVTSSTSYSALSLSAADEGSKDFSLYATFNTMVTDNDNLWFNISSATADAAGSAFVDPDAGGADTDNTGDNNKIVVTATRIELSAPNYIVMNQDFPASINSTDINGNIDLDDVSPVTLQAFSGAGNLSSVAGLSQTLTSGNFTWTDLQYDVADFFVLYAQNTASLFDDTVHITAFASTNENLIISEIADPSTPAQAKYIELYNAGTTIIDFSAETWYVSRHSYTADCSASDWWDYQLTGSIAPGACYIVTSHPSAFDAAYGVGIYDRVGAGMNGNGNDPYMLYKNGDHSSGILIDIYGADECGTGTIWEYTDGHPVRHRDISSPSSVFDADEWTWIPGDSSIMTVKEHKTTKIWDGLSSTDWNEKGTNWDRTYIPDASDNVYIPNSVSNHPVVSLPGACNYLEIESSQDVTVEPGNFFVNVDTINNLRGTEGFVLQNDGAEYASLLHSASLVPGSVESFISQEQWHIVSSPISNGLSGVFLNLYLYSWLETDSTWHYIAPVDVPMNVGEGYFTWASSGLTGDITISYEGYLNSGDINVNMPYTSAASHGGQGWSLVGNPYPSALQFDNRWTFNNVAPTIYVYDGTQYETWNVNTGGTLDTNIVAVGNAFWMKATAAGSVTIPQDARHRYQPDFKNQIEKSQLHFTVSGNGYKDEILVDFREDASIGFDESLDAYKLDGNNEAPQLSIITEGEKLSVNSCRFSENLILPLNLKVGKNSTYSFSLSEMCGFKTKVYLVDLFSNQWIDLQIDEEYTFYANINDSQNRFELRFASPDHVLETGEDNVSIYTNNQILYVNSTENLYGSLYIYNALGQEVFADELKNENYYQLKPALERGNYIVRILTDAKLITQQVRF